MTRRTAATVAMVVLLGASAAPARAQDAPGITLRASRNLVMFGDAVRLAGAIEPPTEGETVEILDDEANVVATTVTDAAGTYRALIEPRHDVKLTARWLAAVSEPVRIRVEPRMTASLSGVRLFGRALARGRVVPRHRGHTVLVELRRAGRVVARHRARLRDGMWFRTRFTIAKPGSYRVRARFDDGDHDAASAWSGRTDTPLPSLTVGSRSTQVALLERHLARLGYHLPPADRYYGVETRDAVIAFNKVQSRARYGSVDAATWRALAHPVVPRARVGGDGTHFEIDQTKQVVYIVREGRVRTIVHTSTGANGYTHDGTYRFYRKLAGTSGGGLYYPSYFDGRRAIHGWPDVPTYPASHGCARIPMWAAQWMHSQTRIGMEVHVYH